MEPSPARTDEVDRLGQIRGSVPVGAPESGAIVVRDAVAADAPHIREVALAAWRYTYAGRIDADVIERFLGQAYTEERIGRRIERHDLLVAGRDGIEAFAESRLEPDHVQLVAIYAHPTVRGRGLGSALLAAVRGRYPGTDIAADVLVGNGLAEPFYAARGFTPGELLTEELAGEPIRERRWWLRVQRRSQSPADAGMVP